MPTATATKPTARPKPAKRKLLGSNPVKHYRALILRGDVPTQEEAIAAGCFASDPATDAATLAARKSAAKVLAGMRGTLQAGREPRRTAQDYGEMPIPATIAELVAAAEKYTQRRDRPYEANADDIAHADAARAEREALQSAGETLWRTASVDLCEGRAGLNKQKQQRGLAIQNRRKIKPILAEIKAAEEERDGIFGRKRTNGDGQLLADAESRLAELRVLVEMAQADAASDATDEAGIDKIQAKIDDAHRKILIPENMRWASDSPIGGVR